MSFHGWTVFALFWVVFVTTPGPNAINCMTNGMQHGFRRALWGVLAILTQATLFLTLSALGITALIAASPATYEIVRLIGAGVLIWLGIHSWRAAGRPVREIATDGRSIYLRGLMGRAALGAVFNIWFRRVMAGAFILYGLLLRTSGATHVRR